MILSKSMGGGLGNMPSPMHSFGGLNSLNAGSNSQGDIIAAAYHTYNSVETLAPLVNQDENLSLTLSSKNAKIFVNPNKNSKAKNLICFVETSYTHQAGVQDEKKGWSKQE